MTPGWDRVAGDPPAVGGAAALQFEPEQPERDLGLAIRGHAVVGTLPGEVVPVDVSAAGRDADLRRHPRSALLQQGQQPGDERDVAEMVGAELQLETVRGGLAVRRGHDARVVDQQVDRTPIGAQRLGERADRVQAGQVEALQGDVRVRGCLADRRHRGLTFGGVADRQHELSARRGEPDRDLETDAVAAPGEDGAATGEGGNGDVEGRLAMNGSPCSFDVTDSILLGGGDAHQDSLISGCAGRAAKVVAAPSGSPQQARGGESAGVAQGGDAFAAVQGVD